MSSAATECVRGLFPLAPMAVGSDTEAYCTPVQLTRRRVPTHGDHTVSPRLMLQLRWALPPHPKTSIVSIFRVACRRPPNIVFGGGGRRQDFCRRVSAASALREEDLASGLLSPTNVERLQFPPRKSFFPPIFRKAESYRHLAGMTEPKFSDPASSLPRRKTSLDRRMNASLASGNPLGLKPGDYHGITVCPVVSLVGMSDTSDTSETAVTSTLDCPPFEFRG